MQTWERLQAWRRCLSKVLVRPAGALPECSTAEVLKKAAPARRCLPGLPGLQEDDFQLKLVCNITGEVNHMSEGLHLGLKGDHERRSQALGRCGAADVTAGIVGLLRVVLPD